MHDRLSALLCVDDDPRVLQLMKEHFSLQGFVVVTARTGLEAFLQAVRWSPRAVILDLFIPGLGGLQALERIRKLDAEITVILISGVPNALDMLAEAGVSVTGAFTKPVDLNRISETLTKAGVTASRLEAGRTPEDSPVSQPPSPIRALVVDDEPEIRSMFTDYLEENGFETLGVWDGEEALRRIAEFRPHVVLLDILMPGLSGIETLRRIRTILPEACVLIVSAHHDLDTAKRALQMGAVDYLHKPVDLKQLDALLGIDRSRR